MRKYIKSTQTNMHMFYDVCGFEFKLFSLEHHAHGSQMLLRL